MAMREFDALRAEVLRLARGGTRPIDIATTMSERGRPVTQEYVRNVLRRARAIDPSVPFFGSPRQETVELRVPKAVMEALQAPAQARNLHTATVARRLLRRIVDDGLVDAVLDDCADRDGGADGHP